MSNVIVFPKGKKGSLPSSMDEVLESVETARREHVELLMDDILSMVFGRSFQEGFDLTSEECIKPTALMVECMRAALYMTAQIEHPLHEMAESMFVDEAEALALAEKLLNETDDPPGN